MIVRAPSTALSPENSLLTAQDLYLFNEGSHYRLYEKLGAHPRMVNGVLGTTFGVWAPAAERVSVIGDFNNWTPDRHPLYPREQSGVWEGFVAGLAPGNAYKFHIASRYNNYHADKVDPFGFHHEIPPRTASIIADLSYDWGDELWMSRRRHRNALSAPVSIYEVHLGSWLRATEEGGRHLSYRELAPRLADHLERTGFTHVEFMPVTEHPFYASWGYQTTGYFAPTSRYGKPQDFMYLVDHLHQRGIGVILDWVPSHFPGDEFGLAYFDGTHLYEHANPQLGFHPDWKSCIFNYGRHEVRSFLLSSGMFWLDRYHVDGLRVDAVASMLYLDYSRNAGEWVPNDYGGNENLGAIYFLRRLNEEVYRNYPDVQTVAEESTAWPMVSRPVYLGGLGFGMKWDMGWMHDTLNYMRREPIYRSYHHGELLFRAVYAFSENYVLALSHDEVVHGKGSLLGKMPGDDWQKFANLRLLYGYQWGVPGKKLLFMGSEWGQGREWNHDAALDWDEAGHPLHEGVQRWVSDLNRLYRAEPALHEQDCRPAGFEWVDCNDADTCVLTFLRKPADSDERILVVCNFTPVPRFGYRVGVPGPGYWREMLNGDGAEYGGSCVGNQGGVEAANHPWHGQPWSLALTVPPLAVVFLKGKAAPPPPPAVAEPAVTAPQAPPAAEPVQERRRENEGD
jgi:1,4-alpha-glucan branching enzyme